MQKKKQSKKSRQFQEPSPVGFPTLSDGESTARSSGGHTEESPLSSGPADQADLGRAHSPVQLSCAWGFLDLLWEEELYSSF